MMTAKAAAVRELSAATSTGATATTAGIELERT
jgi:hypothetical protein